ncbi:OmpA family protein [Burkholderia ubonensis]|uniref:OmpA family protein n=1 Tax=Burkholderia ubonensis TaxID=101571 RepID=UPI0012FDC3A4|nr:OmpA family protein [Burkholderia ubonensis]
MPFPHRDHFRSCARVLTIATAAALLVMGGAGCKRKAASAATGASAVAAATASESTAAPAVAEHASTPPLINVAGLSQGAFVVDKDASNDKWMLMLDEVPDSIGVTANGDRYEAVIALAAPARIQALRFDRIAEMGAARHAQVQASDQSENGPWQTVYDTDLPALAQLDSKTVTARATFEKPVTARWLRVTLTRGSDGSGTISLKQFMALGEFVPGEQATRDVSGVYEFGIAFDMSDFVAIKQDGGTIRGCYGAGDFNGGNVKLRKIAGTFEGGMEPNGYLRYLRHSDDEAWRGVMSFSPKADLAAAQEFPAALGASEVSIQKTRHSVGRKVAAYQNTCPGLATDTVSGALEQNKRVTLYGVNFDLDAATLRPDSRPALDSVVKAVNAHQDWKLAIEGHTDNTGGDVHNQALSQQRAATVREYLINAGIAADRLVAQGFGASRPVAANATPVGRAQNRRVEVAVQ